MGLAERVPAYRSNVTLAATDLISVLWPLGTLMVVLVGGALAWKWYRGRMLEEASSDAIALSPLEELRQLRDQGELTKSEYDGARQRIVDKIKAAGIEVPPEVAQMREARGLARPRAEATGPKASGSPVKPVDGPKVPARQEIRAPGNVPNPKNDPGDVRGIDRKSSGDADSDSPRR